MCDAQLRQAVIRAAVIAWLACEAAIHIGGIACRASQALSVAGYASTPARIRRCPPANFTKHLVAAKKLERDRRRSGCWRASSRWSSASPRTARRAGSSRSAGCSAAATSAEPVKGLYIYGDVGRGKTMLMDLFFEASPVVRKRRAHFHEFMADVHERVRVFRQKLKDGEIEGEDADPARRRRDRRGELAALLRRIPRHRHRRRDDPRPAVRAAVRAGRGGGGDLERGAVRALQGRPQPRAVPAVHRHDRAAHGGAAS